MTACCKQCRLDENKDYCLGCGRTVEEIRQAYQLSLIERRKQNGTTIRCRTCNKEGCKEDHDS
jgi:predicted Fe-S protein YdhL (DUF1289 family)